MLVSYIIIPVKKYYLGIKEIIAMIQNAKNLLQVIFAYFIGYLIVAGFFFSTMLLVLNIY